MESRRPRSRLAWQNARLRPVYADRSANELAGSRGREIALTLKTTGAGSAAHSIGRLWRLSPSAWLIAVAMAASVAFHLIPFYLPAADILAAKFIREKATADLLQSDPAAARLGPSELEAAVTRWTARHADTLMPLERQAEQEIRDGLTFEGEDGERHVYLGDEDGYYWLKLAKSLLAKGTVCD